MFTRELGTIVWSPLCILKIIVTKSLSNAFFFLFVQRGREEKKSNEMKWNNWISPEKYPPGGGYCCSSRIPRISPDSPVLGPTLLFCLAVAVFFCVVCFCLLFLVSRHFPGDNIPGAAACKCAREVCMGGSLRPPLGPGCHPAGRLLCADCSGPHHVRVPN